MTVIGLQLQAIWIGLCRDPSLQYGIKNDDREAIHIMYGQFAEYHESAWVGNLLQECLVMVYANRMLVLPGRHCLLTVKG